MGRSLLILTVFSWILLIFQGGVLSNTKNQNTSLWNKRKEIAKKTKMTLPGINRSLISQKPIGESRISLGSNVPRSSSPGLTVGYTTMDIQSVSRMTRQVNWRTANMVHFTWMVQTDDIPWVESVTHYEVWDTDEMDFLYKGPMGGCQIHAPSSYSEFPGIEIDTEDKAVIANHHASYDDMMTTLYYDFESAACFFSPYTRRIPDSLCLPLVQPSTDFEFQWPSHAYQVVDGDTVTHVFAQQKRYDGSPQYIAYFRRFGSGTLGTWDMAMIVDMVHTISQIVTSSPVSPKVALVWQAPPGDIPGNPESLTRDWYDPGLGFSQRINDIYIMISNDMGTNWGGKMNITAFDSSIGGWLGQGDMSALIASDDNLHIVWPAREVMPNGYSLGEFTNFWGSRLLHWDEYNNEIRTVKDANWDISEYGDYTCTGGEWNETSICKPMLSECDGKLYTIFVQYQDFYSGIYDDCAERRFTHGIWQGTANGELFISVSENGGLNWDYARNLTGTYTPYCDSAGPDPCESDVYPSMPQFGMDITGLEYEYENVPVVDPSGEYSGDHYLDVFYLSDRFPGGCLYNSKVWTMNEVKWFRVPCVDPISTPVLVISPKKIDDPTWVKPDHQKDTTIRLENVGNAELYINNITVSYLSGSSGWLGVSESGPFSISHLSPNYHDIDLYLNQGGIISYPGVAQAYVVIDGDFVNYVDSIFVSLIVADTVQFPELADIRTDCIRLNFNNAGNLGNNGNPLDGNYNMDYFYDCDTTDNSTFSDDNANVYLKEGSPFVLRIKDGYDTVLNYSMYDAGWLSDDGFRPLEGLLLDSINPDYKYAYSKFTTKDSTVDIILELYAPGDFDTCDFIVKKEQFINNSGSAINDIMVGSIMDWDIPSDSGVENGSNFHEVGGEASRDLMYCYGGEYGPDDIENNDCVLADQRLGGLAFYNGYKAPFDMDADSLQNPDGPWWTHMNADWVEPTGGFVASQLYRKIEGNAGWQIWEATNPTLEDSLYQDLHMVACYGQFDLDLDDTLVFVTIMASGYDNGEPGLIETIDKARQWISNRPYIFSWPERIVSQSCCDNPGDANGSGGVAITDITYLISYLYMSGPAPPCPAEADADGSGESWESPEINILDVFYLFRYLYCMGPPPVCPPSKKSDLIEGGIER